MNNNTNSHLLFILDSAHSGGYTVRMDCDAFGLNDEQRRALTNALPAWYETNGRRLPWRADTDDPYRILVSESMLQQTRAAAVIPYYERFVAALPDAAGLSAASDDVLYKLWEGLGYYARARNLRTAARELTERHNGVFPSAHADILRLKGVGAYTAGAIASVCFNLPTPAVDGNVLRVLSRLTVCGMDVKTPAARDAAIRSLRPAYEAAACRGTLTQALMELGALVCTPKSPACAACPVKSVCAAARTNAVSAYPVRGRALERPILPMTVFIFECGDKRAFLRRGETGLLAGLYELPNVPGVLEVEAAVAHALTLGFSRAEPKSRARKTHIFTHKTWDMLCYTLTVPEMPERFIWADSKTVTAELSVPTAFKKLLG